MPKTYLELIKENYSARADLQGELRDIDEKATAEKRDYTDDEKATIEEKRGQLKTIDDRIISNLEMEMADAEVRSGIDAMLGAMVDRERGEVVDTRSIGQAFVGTDEFRAFSDADGQGRSYPSVTLERDFRAVTNLSTAVGSGGAFITPDRLDRIGQDRLDRRTFLIDVLPHIPVGSEAAEYVQDKTPEADLESIPAETAEGAAKPQAGLTFDVVNEKTPTIPVWANLTRQAASSAPQVQAYLDNRLRYALRRKADGQVINGPGTGITIRGLANRLGINTVAPGAAEAAYKTIRKAITEMEVDEVVPELIVLNPRDAEVFDLSNEATAGLHAVPNVNGPSARTSWGLTQVRSNALAPGTALVIDPMAVAVLDRQDPTAYLTDSHASNFTSNILTLLLEMRLGLAVFEPVGICKVTFDHD